MNSSSEQTIYFHVGTGKTGTTFLQYRVFPKFKGIHYIQRTQYKKAIKIIQSTTHPKYLVSREFDQQLEREVRAFAQTLPQATPIIVFRRHDSYIASQYRRFVKNGYTAPFSTFFNLQNDTGYFKQQDLNYYRQIEILEQCFEQKPIVLFYENMKQNPKAFIAQLATHLGVQIDYQEVDFSKKHASYSEQQLKAIQAVGKYINLRKRRVYKNGFLHLLFKMYLGSVRYTTLYIAKWLPSSFFSDQPLIDAQELQAVQAFYQADWTRCQSYAQQRND